MPRTIFRLRSRTPDMSMVKPLCVIPYSRLFRKYDATLALWMMFLLGRHAMFGHDPPIYLRSMVATRFPSPANVQAAIVDPVPPPRMTRSNSCTFASCGDCADILERLFMPIPPEKRLSVVISEVDISGPRRTVQGRAGECFPICSRNVCRRSFTFRVRLHRLHEVGR